MPPWAPITTEVEASARAISSPKMAKETGSAPAPPNSSGMAMPMKPISAIFLSRDLSRLASRFCFIDTGRISASTNSLTAWRNMKCSSRR
ncbi:hypothetical protein D3C72_650470 [compost metagenome]